MARSEAEVRAQLQAERRAAAARLAAAEESIGELRSRAERAERLAEEERAERRCLAADVRARGARRRPGRGEHAARAAARRLTSSS
ncbi:hypothetical protein BJ981_002071 [Sphaerisporangium krabiense]|uniref:Uncharacterized protein n=1 Tax=Sphaerisporangium krabiense TaxID=763782 RepID=A0A7W8Z2X5_9ACTN|nr:hypothetical protein [Sphaerisporangium krabiense]